MRITFDEDFLDALRQIKLKLADIADAIRAGGPTSIEISNLAEQIESKTEAIRTAVTDNKP